MRPDKFTMRICVRFISIDTSISVMLKKAYRGIDGLLMYGANKFVHSWNWTTGRTRAELADLLLLSGSATLIAKSFQDGPWGVGTSCVFYGLGHSYAALNNLEIDKLEEVSSANGMKHPTVELFKHIYRYYGPSLLVVGALSLATPSTWPNGDSRTGEKIVGVAAITACGIHAYVMRADNLPPRKNVLSRAKDRLAELISRRHQIDTLSFPELTG